MKKLPPKKERCTFIFSKTWQCRSVIYQYVIYELMSFLQFGGNPVACAIGMAVLDVIHNEKLMSSARNVGKCLMDGMRAIAPNHPMLGDIRGTGMVIGIEIVTDQESKKPSKEGAEILAYK